jgi:hypothetical protein
MQIMLWAPHKAENEDFSFSVLHNKTYPLNIYVVSK